MSRVPKFRLRLYVADGAQNSVLARTNLKAMCNIHLPTGVEIEVVDVLRQPERALADGVFMTPMLLRLSPLPVRRIVGTLGQVDTVLLALGLDREAV